MHCWRYILAVVTLILVAQTTAICRKRRDLHGEELRTLLGSTITHSQVVRRPLQGSDVGRSYPFSHTGMLVETSRQVDGTNRWLIHKDKGLGTVVTRADYMSSRWETHGSPQPGDGSTVSDFVRRGGREYHVSAY